MSKDNNSMRRIYRKSMMNYRLCGSPRCLFLSLVAGFCFFGVYMLNLRPHCSIDVFLSSIVHNIKSNSELLIDDVFLEPCWGIEDGEKEANKFEQSIRNLLESCMKMKPPRRGRTSNQPILTLMTTWVASPNKYQLHNITVKNWRNISSEINLVLFTDDRGLESLVAKSGWKVLPVRHSGINGIPVFKSMFEDAMNQFKSSFYAYANSDILFDESLIETLQFIETEMNDSMPLLLTGRRINVQDLTASEAHPLSNLQRVVQERGELFQVDAQDVFIVNSHYRYFWKTVPDLIVGRPAFDNWIVASSICSGLKVVDVTKTILMVHQTLNGNEEGFSHTDKYYNRDLLLKQGKPSHYSSGYTNCIELRIFRDYCGIYEVGRRQSIPEKCSCEYWV